MCTTAETGKSSRQSCAAEKLRGHRLRISVISELYHTWMNPVMRAEGYLDASLSIYLSIYLMAKAPASRSFLFSHFTALASTALPAVGVSVQQQQQLRVQ